MKNLIHLSSFILFLCSSSVLVGAVDKEKEFRKSYPLNSGDRVEIYNQFGDVDIETWNKSEVSVEVTIFASARSDEAAQRLLDAIRIKDRSSNGVISFKSEIGKNANRKTKKDHRTTEFSIDWVVRIPASQELELTCEFGHISMPDYGGQLDLVSKFGSVDGGELGDVRDLLVEFGKLKLDGLHGSRGAIKFSSANVRMLTGENDLDIEFCNDVEFTVGSAIEEIDFSAANSTVTLELPNALSARYDIKTSFGSFKNATNYTIEDDDDKENSWGPDFDDHFKGRSGSGTVPIYIDSSFSKIRFED